MGDQQSERPERYVKAFKGVQSTGGAVQIRNEKGELLMEKVKVSRYIAGKRPSFANEDSDESDEDEEEQLFNPLAEKTKQLQREAPIDSSADRRLQRLQQSEGASDRHGVVSADLIEDEEEAPRRRRVRTEAEIVDDDGDAHGAGEADVPRRRVRAEAEVVDEDDDEEDEVKEDSRTAPAIQEEESDEDEDEADRRRELARGRARERAKIEPVIEEEMAIEDEDDDVKQDESEESEWETATESEDDTPMLKPTFVSKAQRKTTAERDAREAAEAARAVEAGEKLKERKVATRNLLASTMQHEMDAAALAQLGEHDIDDTDDKYNEEEEFEAWKVRELKRIKRDTEQRAAEEAERLEVERLRDMTEAERVAALAIREKKIVNKKEKGKMKFLQKYYHRGAFFMDKEEEIYKRDVWEPTLDDHFDKETMPKPMQVKKFGFMSNTKYTHLADQDTSAKDSPWAQANSINARAEAKRAGTKPVFERPSTKRKRD